LLYRFGEPLWNGRYVLRGGGLLGLWGGGVVSVGGRPACSPVVGWGVGVLGVCGGWGLWWVVIFFFYFFFFFLFVRLFLFFCFFFFCFFVRYFFCYLFLFVFYCVCSFSFFSSVVFFVGFLCVSCCFVVLFWRGYFLCLDLGGFGVVVFCLVFCFFGGVVCVGGFFAFGLVSQVFFVLVWCFVFLRLLWGRSLGVGLVGVGLRVGG